MNRIKLAHAYKPFLLAALLTLGALACNDSDSGDSGATRTPEPAIGTGAPVANVAMGTATVAANDNVTVDLIVTPNAGVTIGALDVDVLYDNSTLNATACTPEGCNEAFAVDTIRFSMASLEGLSGPVGTITFSSIGSEGATSPLRVLLQTCANVEAEIIACSATDGSVTIGPP